MRLSTEQFAALAPYEEHFKTACKANSWSRHPGSAALDLMHTIQEQVTGVRYRLDKHCSHCILKQIRDVGYLYLADKQERIDMENRKTFVEKTLQEAETKTKVEVKTKKGGRRPKK